jgi:hypothetical protein
VELDTASNSRAESVSREQDGPETNGESETQFILGKRGRSFEEKDEDERHTRTRIDDGGIILMGDERVIGWSIALQKLIKGKTPISKEVSHFWMVG